MTKENYDILVEIYDGARKIVSDSDVDVKRRLADLIGAHDTFLEMIKRGDLSHEEIASGHVCSDLVDKLFGQYLRLSWADHLDV